MSISMFSLQFVNREYRIEGAEAASTRSAPWSFIKDEKELQEIAHAVERVCLFGDPRESQCHLENDVVESH